MNMLPFPFQSIFSVWSTPSKNNRETFSYSNFLFPNCIKDNKNCYFSCCTKLFILIFSCFFFHPSTSPRPVNLNLRAVQQNILKRCIQYSVTRFLHLIPSGQCPWQCKISVNLQISLQICNNFFKYFLTDQQSDENKCKIIISLGNMYLYDTLYHNSSQSSLFYYRHGE